MQSRTIKPWLRCPGWLVLCRLLSPPSGADVEDRRTRRSDCTGAIRLPEPRINFYGSHTQESEIYQRGTPQQSGRSSSDPNSELDAGPADISARKWIRCFDQEDAPGATFLRRMASHRRNPWGKRHPRRTRASHEKCGGP